MYRIKRRKTKRIRTGEVPRLSGYGDLATFRLAGTKAATGLSRTSTVGGIDRMGKFARNENLGDLEVTAPPYGALAVGAGLAALGAGAAAAFAPLSGTVKILLTALGIASAGGCAYSLKKRADVGDVKITADFADKLMRGGTNYLQAVSQVPEMADKLKDDRMRAYFNYNSASSVAKFVKYDDRMVTQKDPVTGEGVTAYFDSYPDWVDTMRLTVGEKSFQRAVHDTLNALNNAAVARGGASTAADYGIGPMTPFLPIENEESGLVNNYGLLNKDAFVTLHGCNMLACAEPPIQGDRPVYYHIINGRILDPQYSSKMTINEKYVNGQNYEDVKTNIDNVPENALIVGTRFVWSGSGSGGFDDVRRVWRDNAGITYDQIFSDPSLVANTFLPMRPDLWMFSAPVLPGTVVSGKADLSIVPFLRAKGSFELSGLFQPFLANCRYFVMEKSEFVRLHRVLRYEMQWVPSEGQKALARFLRLAAIIISVAAAVVVTVASWGTASVPAWAGAVTLIVTVLATTLNLAAKWIESGSRGFAGSLMEGVVDVWGALKGNIANTSGALDTHFARSAAVFVEKVRTLTGRVIAETDLQNEQIMYALKAIGNNIKGDFPTFKAILRGVVPELPSGLESKLTELQNAIVEGSQITNGTFMEAKASAEADIRGRITEIDNGLITNAVTKLAVLF